MTRSRTCSTVRTIAFSLSLAIATLAHVDRAHADDVANEEESKNCVTQVSLCAAGVGGAAAGIISQCKPLRQCKKECRVEKRDCKKDTRDNKKSCKEACRDTHDHGKEYRECAAACRDDKHDAKDDCKEAKTVCKDICRDSFKTPECKAARGAALLSVPACATMVSCIVSSSKQDEQ